MSETANRLIADWVNLYGRDLLRWAILRISNRAVAEDLVQDTFISALQQIHRFEGKSSPKTWLISILKNKVADHYRQSFKSGQVSLPENVFFDSDESWKSGQAPGEWIVESEEKLLDNPDFSKTLEDCLSKLSGPWRNALLAKYLDEKDAKLICQELNIQPTNYWQMVHRAKLQIRKCLEINWFKS